MANRKSKIIDDALSTRQRPRKAKLTTFERLSIVVWDEFECQADLPEKQKRPWRKAKEDARAVVERNEIRRVVAAILLELRKVKRPKGFKEKIDSIFGEMRGD